MKTEVISVVGALAVIKTARLREAREQNSMKHSFLGNSKDSIATDNDNNNNITTNNNKAVPKPISVSRCRRRSCLRSDCSNDATKFAYLIDKNKSFARPFTCLFYFCAFLSRSGKICDVE